MKKSYILIIITALLFPVANGADFSAREKSVIYTNAIQVLQNYQSIINSIGETVVTDVEKSKINSENLLELFVNRQVMLYNDLDPSHKLSEFYEAETYASNLILWYPDGINIDMDFTNARVSEIRSHEDNVYSIDVMLTKKINGNYINQVLNKNTETLNFRIAFVVENKDLKNFRIVGVRNAASETSVDFSKALRETNSENLNVEELNKIYSDLKLMLQDYTNFLSLIGDPQETPEDKEFYKQSFIKMFMSPDARIYNDVTPEPQAYLISAKEYLDSYIADYPNGIKNLKINTDSATFGKVMKSDDGRYYTFVDANKFFSGAWKGKDAFRKMFPLVFKISFTEEGKLFSGYAINSIDISAVDYFVDTQEGKLERQPGIIISPVTRKGWSLSFCILPAITSIHNRNTETLTLDKDFVNWSTASEPGYKGSIGLSYYYNDNIAFVSGLELNRYSGKFILSGTFRDNVESNDGEPNYRTFYKVIEADYDSVISVNYLTIPVGFSYMTGKPGMRGFYAEAGAKFSVPLSGTYSSSGYYRYYGDYTAIDWTDQDFIPDKGFYDHTGIDNSAHIPVSGINIALYASAGINIPLGYYTSVMIGPEISLGISDSRISNSVYRDIFGKTHSHLPTKINSFGLRLSFSYKL